MLKYAIRDLRDGDLDYLSRNLRGADVIEYYGTYGDVRALHGLQSSTATSQEVRITVGASGKPMFLCGYARFSARVGLIWAVGTAELDQRPYHRPFLRLSKETIGRWFKQTDYEYFCNFVHTRNTVHIKWLQWLHAELLPAMPYGPVRHEFHPFIIRRNSYV